MSRNPTTRTAPAPLTITVFPAARRAVVVTNRGETDLYEYDTDEAQRLVLYKESTGESLYTVQAGVCSGCKSKQYRPNTPCRHERLYQEIVG